MKCYFLFFWAKIIINKSDPMLLTNIKIETRQNHLRPSKSKAGLKTKSSLPQNGSSAKTRFEQMKLTQSHEIQDVAHNQFQLNVIPPNSKTSENQALTKKFTCPEWIAVSQMKSSFQTNLTQTALSNPENGLQNHCNSNGDYQNSREQSQETDHQHENQMATQNNQTQIIMEITTNQNKENQCSSGHVRLSRNYEDLQYKSAFILNHHHSSDSDKGSLTSLQLQNVKNKSAFTEKAKSTLSKSIKSRQDLQQFHKQEFDKLSEYGLKPYEENRLKKIQQIQKIELLREEHEDQFENPNQEYFNVGRAKKTGQVMTKFRKCSAIVEVGNHTKVGKSVSKKSLSKQKHSLSKGKKSGLQNKISQIPNLKSIRNA